MPGHFILWWWLGGSDQPPTVLPDDLLGAIHDQMASSASVSGALGGRHWTGQVADADLTGAYNPIVDPTSGLMLPYCLVTELTSDSRYNTTNGYYDEVAVRWDVYADDPDTARANGKLVEALFAPVRGYTPLAFADGAEMIRLPQDSRLVKAPDRGPNAEEVWCQRFEVLFLVDRTMTLVP